MLADKLARMPEHFPSRETLKKRALAVHEICCDKRPHVLLYPVSSQHVMHLTVCISVQTLLDRSTYDALDIFAFSLRRTSTTGSRVLACILIEFPFDRMEILLPTFDIPTDLFKLAYGRSRDPPRFNLPIMLIMFLQSPSLFVICQEKDWRFFFRMQKRTLRYLSR